MKDGVPDKDFFTILGVGFFIGFFVCLVIVGVWMDREYNKEINNLGHAICKEEYGKDFQRYSTDSGLECKDSIRTKEYDGIKVKLN